MLITTGVDALIKLVREKGKVEIALAARFLNIPISTIEEWSHALENEGIISIEYQLTKIYLRWVPVTTEKIDAESAALDTQRIKLLEEIKQKEEMAIAQLADVSTFKDEFNANYTKIMEKLAEMEKKSVIVESAKKTNEENYYKLSDTLGELHGKITELGDSVKFMHTQLEKTRTELLGADIEKKMKGIVESRTATAELKKELDGMESVISKTLHSLSAKHTDVSSLQKAMESIHNNYSALKKEMNKELKILEEAEQASVLFKENKKKINELYDSLGTAKQELKDINGSLPEIESKLIKSTIILKKNEEKLAQFEDALHIAEEKIKHFTADERGYVKIQRLLQEGKALGANMEKFNADIQETSNLFENVDKIILNFSELKKRIDKERKRLAEESGAIFASLDEEITNYSTFQKIKEKAVATINDYLRQLEKIEVSYEKIVKEAERMEKNQDDVLASLRQSKDYKDTEQLTASIDELIAKRKILGEIWARIEALDASANKTTKHVKLLAKEAELIQLRASSTISEEREGAHRAVEEVKESITLTENEQKDFDEKRNELRKLIKKLWEEE